MIISVSKQNVYISRLPFEASFNQQTQKVSFSGKIFNLYDNQTSQLKVFKNGANYFEISGEYDFVYGDWFYLDVRNQIELSLIKKVSKEDRESFDYSLFEIPILIWKGPNEEGKSGEQILTENIFLQDYESCRRRGFHFYKEEKDKEAETISNKFSSGFIINPQTNYYKHFPSFLKSCKYGEEPSYRLKINVTATLSEADPDNNGDMAFINSFSINDATIEEFSEEAEDDSIKIGLTPKLTCNYYIENISLSNGVTIIFFTTQEEPNVLVSPGWETQVKGAGFYKNGVAILSFPSGVINENDHGYYKTIVETKTYPKYTIDGGTGGATRSGDHIIITTYSVDGEGFVSEQEPIVTADVDEDPLLGNEFVVEPPEIEVELVGGEISQRAYSECLGIVNSQDWTPIKNWEGDPTVVLEGAGKNGTDEKTDPNVYHGERRFKKVGLILGVINNDRIDFLPDSFLHHSAIFFSDGSEEPCGGEIPLVKSETIYRQEDWTEIAIKGDGVYGKELVDGSDLGPTEYLEMDITKYANEFYQTFVMTSNPSVVV